MTQNWGGAATLLGSMQKELDMFELSLCIALWHSSSKSCLGMFLNEAEDEPIPGARDDRGEAFGEVVVRMMGVELLNLKLPLPDLQDFLDGERATRSIKEETESKVGFFSWFRS